MTFRDKIRERAIPHIPAGEAYRVSFQVEQAWLGVAGLLPRYRVVVVTDQRIHLFTASLWRVCDPGRWLGSFPLSTLVPSGRSFLRDEIHIAGQQFWVNFRYRDLLREAVAVARRPSQ